MYQLIDAILSDFRACFKRQITWQWFVVLITGFISRLDLRGVTSVVTAMCLKPGFYRNLLHFFRSDAYTVEALQTQWIKTARKHSEATPESRRIVTLGDHSKVSKEGLYMPGIEILHQDSQNSGKPAYIAGHNFAQVSALVGDGKVYRSLPLVTELQESRDKSDSDADSLVARMVKLAGRVVQTLGEPTVLVLDAYFSSHVAWDTADSFVAENGEKLLSIVTRAQKNTVAYMLPVSREEKRRGRPAIYGEKVTLRTLFADPEPFTRTVLHLYGKDTKVSYLCLNLLWKPVKRLVRFVLVDSPRGQCVLMSSDLGLPPEEIIQLYAMRFKIETSFDEQKNDMGGFAYHFWTSAMPKRGKWKKAQLPTKPHELKNATKAMQAINTFVCLNTIATGISTLIAFSHSREIWEGYPGWLRTIRSPIPSVATVKLALAGDFHAALPFLGHLASFSFIPKLLQYKERFRKTA